MTLEDGLINVIHELYNEQKPKEVIRGGVYKQNKNKSMKKRYMKKRYMKIN